MATGPRFPAPARPRQPNAPSPSSLNPLRRRRNEPQTAENNVELRGNHASLSRPLPWQMTCPFFDSSGWFERGFQLDTGDFTNPDENATAPPRLRTAARFSVTVVDAWSRLAVASPDPTVRVPLPRVAKNIDSLFANAEIVAAK